MHFQIFINPQGVESCCIKAGQEHIDHNQQINLTLFYFIGQVLIVILKALAGCIKVRLERLVVVTDCHIQKIARTLIELIGIKALIFQNAICAVCFVGSKRVDGCNRQLAVLFFDLFFQFQIIFFADWNRTDCQHGVKSIYTLTFQAVIGIAHCFLIEVFQNILYNLGNTLLRSQCFFGINGSNLLILLSVLLFYGVDIVNAERQNISVIDGVNDGVGMKLITERLLGSF